MTEAEELELLQLKAKASQPPGMLERAGNALASGAQAVGQFIENKIDAPARRMVGLPATPQEFSQKSGLTSDAPLLPGWIRNTVAKAAEGSPAWKMAQMSYDKSVKDTAEQTYAQVATPLNLIPPGLKVLGAAGSKLAPLATKAAASRTGIPAKTISTYAEHTGDVDKIINSGVDGVSGAEALQSEMNQALIKKRAMESARVERAVEGAPQAKTIESAEIINEMQAKTPGRVGANGEIPMSAKLNGAGIREAEGMVDNVIKATNGGGKVSVEDLHAIKQHLQEIARGSYAKEGQIFQVGKQTQQTAKTGGAIARKALAKTAPEEYVRANAALERLHLLEERLKRSGATALITEGKPTNQILTAGAGTNPKSSSLMRRIGAATGTDPLGKAEKLAAAQEFRNPGWTAKDVTGKGGERLKVFNYGMGGAGAAAGFGIGGPVGAAIGAALGTGASVAFSPASLKRLLQANAITRRALSKVADIPVASPVTDAVVLKAYNTLQSHPEGPKILQEMLKEAATAPKPAAPERRNPDSVSKYWK